MVPLFWDGGESTFSTVFLEVRRLSNSEKSSLIVPFKLLKRSKAPEEAEAEVDTDLEADAAAQASVVFPALGAGACEAAQGSELLATECVPAPVPTPQGSTEAAGLAPNDDQESEVLAEATGPPQGLVWLVWVGMVAGPQGSAFGAGGPELGRESIKSNRVVCCG